MKAYIRCHGARGCSRRLTDVHERRFCERSPVFFSHEAIADYAVGVVLGLRS
jgi:hypothetical protein